MLKNYFKISWRYLQKNKTFSFINIFGLTIGLTSFLLISLYIFDELTFDRFHKNADNIYRLIEEKTSPEGKETKFAGAGYQVTEKTKTVFPEVREGVRLVTLSRINVSTIDDSQVFYEDFTLANQDFLSAFDFELLSGDPNSALTAPHSVIITEETAKKLFNTSDVLGKEIKVDRDSIPFKVTGVLKNIPVNSHLKFNLLFSESSINNNEFAKFVSSDWNSAAFASYLLLKGKTDIKKLEAKINQLAKANQSNTIGGKSRYTLQPIKNIHFYSVDIEGNSGQKGNISNIYIFSIIALFVLIIACINYVNLTTARFTNRAKEIAVRKVVGASRKNLVGQFLSEAFLLTIIALLFALALVKILLPPFNSFAEKQLTLGLNTDYQIWMFTALILIVVALLSGIYPALFQSRFKPFVLLRSRVNFGRGYLSIRRLLVVFQFSLSIIMIIATIVIYMQMKYINSKDMGFNKNQLLVIDINSGKVRESAGMIKSEFLKLAQVKEISVSSRVPGEWKDLPKVKVKNERMLSSEGEDMYFLGVDEHFLKTYQITLVKGRNFGVNSLSDSSSVIINETAAKELGINYPNEQMIEIPLEKPFVARVIGIVKDFNFQSLHEPLAPMVLGFQKNPVQSIDYFTVKVTTNNMSETFKNIEAILRDIDQNHLFEYHFLDKQWDLLYRQDKIRETIFFIVATLTILIACLGLFGLATYTAEQRVKEIGIRKVLGASIDSIVFMLSTEFLKLVCFSALVAFPLAWWAMHHWLQNYAYRITINWWIFVLAASIAAVVALLTVSFQTIKAAITNPVKSLRTE